MNAESQITGWNRQAEATFGRSEAEAVGRQMAELIIPPRYRQAHRRGLCHFLQTGEGPVLGKRIELTALHRSGREFPIELTITPIRKENSYVFCAFVHDITDRKRAESELRESELRRRLVIDSTEDYAIFMLYPEA